MAWVKVDDGFPTHPKLLSIPRPTRLEAIGLWLLGVCFSNSKLTDGFLASFVVSELLAGSPRDDLPSILVNAGLWESIDGGFLIHDYHEYNPSKKQVLSIRSKRQASGKQGGLASGKQRRSKPALSAEAPSRPVPAPSRPQDRDTPLAPTGANGLPDWFRETLRASRHFAVLSEGHGEFWAAMSRAYDPYEWLKWDEQVQKADAWIAANPQRAPTLRGLPRFLRNWFERAVERQRKEQRAQTQR